MRIGLVVLSLTNLALVPSAWAATVQQSLRVAPGLPLALGIQTSGRPDCTVGSIPRTRVLTPPRHGTATVRSARVRPQGDPCPAAPGYVVVYRSDPDFSGTDELTLEVGDGDKVTTEVFRIFVTRGDPAPPADL
jgi:hypothetical protein